MASACESEMGHSTTTTPPATPSRASTLPAVSVERSSISIEPPRMNNLAEFKAYPHIPDSQDLNPAQMLMQTPITIEYGLDLTTKLTLHEEILCCHSKQLQRQFSHAKSVRTQFLKADKFRESLAAYVFPETSEKEFEERNFEQEVKVLIKTASENYPVIGYASGIKKHIIDAVAEQISAKNIKKTAQKPSQISSDLSLAGRLDLLKPHAVQAVAAKLFARLHAINKAEIKKAEKDPLKAAVQHRILLPGVEEATVWCFVQWIYRGTCPYKGSEQLYSVLKLATQLGVEGLASNCLNQLYNAVNDSLRHASAQGVLLQALLGYGSDAATDDAVGVVFKHAVKDENIPKQLKSLVVDALAASLDIELWTHVKDLLNHGMALQVIEAMIELRQHIKTEMDDQDSIKSESKDAPSASILSVVPVDD